ncbi:Hypothetical_protein [Hexamita inflata]|uniref:Hypothetical_protein n=1 Tax=Hexamita inflata TaxID=28002 RepID=A0AA86UZB1_9EUKA|nr:Hypothetical protein HINF_LOCUS57917 [Hexamita inflata]
MRSTTINSENITATAQAQAHAGCLFGLVNATFTIDLYETQVMNSQVYSKTTGDAISTASGTIGGLLWTQLGTSTPTFTTQYQQLQNIKITSISTQNDSISAGIIALQQAAVSVVNQLSLNSVNIVGQGYDNAYQGGIIGSFLYNDAYVQDYSAFKLSLTAATQTNNVSIGGAVGYVVLAKLNLINCSVEQANIVGTGYFYAFMSGFCGSFQNSKMNQSQSLIFNSTIQGQSLSRESNAAGYFGIAELSTRLYYEDCSVESIFVSAQSVTCRSILFGGRIEGAFVDITKIRIANSRAITPLSQQPRAGSLFGRVYYSVVNAVLVTIENVILSAMGTTFESEVSGVTTSLYNTSLAFRDSSIKNINITSYSTVNSARAAALFSTTESSNLYVVNVQLEVINILIQQDNISVPIYAAAIVNCFFVPDTKGSLQMNHVTLNTMNITTIPSTVSMTVNTVIGLQQSKETYVEAIDCYSVGIIRVQTLTSPECQWQVQVSGSETTMRWTGCA